MSLLNNAINSILKPRKNASIKGSSFSNIMSYLFSSDSNVYELALSNVDVLSCINLIGENIGLGGVAVFDTKGKQIKDTDEKYIFLTNLISKIKVEFVKHKSIGGVVYIVQTYNEKGNIVGYEIFGSNEVRQSNGMLYIKHDSGDEIEVGQDDYHKLVFSRDHNGKPKGILESIIKDLKSEQESSTSILMSYINKLRIGAIIKTSDKLNDVNAEKALGEEFKKIFTGSKNEGSYYIGNAIDSVNMVDMNIKNESIWNDRDKITDKICVAYRIPREVLGYTQKSGSEAKIQGNDKIFMRSTMNAWDKCLQDAINDILYHFMPNDYLGYTITIGSDNSLSTEEQENIRSNFEKGIITQDEARLALGYNTLTNG